MKKITKILLCVASLGANFAYSQNTIYADTVLSVSSEYSVCPNNWSSCKIIGAPDVYPNCGDLPGSWSFSAANNTTTPHPREWIEIGYNTQYYVDSINVYQTNYSGLIDTIYFRDAQTGTWNIVFSDTAIFNNNCDVFRLGMPTTLYKVDAVRLAISGNYTSLYPEFDAVALIGGVTTAINEQEANKTVIFPNPSNGQLTIKTEGKGTSAFTIFDVFGNVVLSQKLSQETENISVNIPAGVYFSVIENKGEKITNKLIIQ